MSDVIIIGNGPAGISASLYTTRAGLKTTIIGKDYGALQKTDKIDNYYGFVETISGTALIENGIKQAERLGAELITAEVLGLSYDTKISVKTSKGDYSADGVIIATGTQRTVPKISGILEFEGKGISYCAVCDSFFYKGKDVAVLGCCDYALHEAMELLPIAKSVTIVTNGENPIANIPNEIKVITTGIKEFSGNDTIENVLFQDGSQIAVSGIFIAVGVAGSSDLARKIGVQTQGNNIIVDESMKTNVPAVYAAGDCTGGMLQIAKAVYEGAQAGSQLVKYIRKQKGN